MRLRLNTTLRAALIAAITAVGFTLSAGQQAQAATPESYSGLILTWNNTSKNADLAYGKYRETDYASGEFSDKGIERAGWKDPVQGLIGTDNTDDRNTLRFAANTYGQTVKAIEYTFTPLALAGFIVDSGAEGYSIVAKATGSDRAFYLGNDNTNTAAYSSINEDFTFDKLGGVNKVFLRGVQTIDVASGKTFTLGSNNGFDFTSNLDLTVTGGGTLAFTRGGVTMASGASLTVQAGSTVSFASAVSGLSTTINNAGKITFASDTVTLGTDLSGFDDFAATYEDCTGVPADNGFVVEIACSIIKNTGVGQSNLSKVVYGGNTYNLDANGKVVVGENYTTYYLNTDGATVDLAQAITRSSGALTTVVAKGKTGTITVNSNSTLGSLSIASGSTATVNGTAELTLNGLAGAGALNIAAGTTTLGSAITNAFSGTVSVANATLNLGSNRQNISTLTIGDGGVVNATGANNSDGCISGDINIKAGGTFKMTGHHDGFGWGNNATKNIILTGESNSKLATLELNQTTTNSATMKTNIAMHGYSKITSSNDSKGFNTYGGSIFAENTNNTIDKIQLRSDATIQVAAAGELSVGNMIYGTDGGHNLTKTGEGTLTFTGVANMNSLILNGGSVVFNGTSSIANGLTQVEGKSITVGGSLTLGGTVTFGHQAIGVTGSGSIAKGENLKFNLNGLTATQNDDTWTYTLFSGTAVDLKAMGLSATDLILEGGTSGKNWVFGTDGTISYTASTEKVWTQEWPGNWNYEEANWNTDQKFEAGDVAVFEGGPMVTVNAEVEAGGLVVRDDTSMWLMAAQEGASLSSPSINIGQNANMASMISIDGVETFSVGTGSAWGISADQQLGTGVNDGAMDISEGCEVTITSLTSNGTVNVQEDASLYLGDTTTADELSRMTNDGTLSVALGSGTTLINMRHTNPDATQLYGTLVVRSGTVDYRSNLDGQTLQLGNGAELLFGENTGDTTHSYAGDIVVADGDTANVHTWGSSKHSQTTLSGDVSGEGTLVRTNDGDQALNFTGTVFLGGFTNNDAQDNNVTDFQGATTLGTLTVGNKSKTKFSNANTTIDTITVNGSGTVEFANSITLNGLTSAGNHALTLNATNGAAVTIAGANKSLYKLVTAGDIVIAEGTTLALTNNLTPNSGTVTVNGTVNISNELDLSNGKKSTGTLKVGSTGVVNVSNGMWMAKAASVALEENGTFKLAGLSIVGKADGGSITTTAEQIQYSKGNTAVVIDKATVTATANATGDGTIKNKLVDTTVNAGTYAVAVENANNAIAGATVGAGGSFTMTTGTLTDTITNGNGTVSLSGITLGDSFAQEGGENTYVAVDGTTPVNIEDNYYLGNTKGYVTVVTGTGTVSGSNITWNGGAYALQDDGTIITKEAKAADFSTFYLNKDSENISDILAHNTTAVQVNAGTLVVNQDASGVDITVTNEGTISGDKADAKQVDIASGATAYYTGGVEDSGVKFTPSELLDGAVEVDNYGQTQKYSIASRDLSVAAAALEMTGTEDVTVSNYVVVDKLVNTTDKVLTLDNQETFMLLTDMSITGSTVQVYTDATHETEGVVAIDGILQGGGATLKADLTLYGGSTLDVDGGDTHALTLGSTLAIDTTDGLVNLDQETIAALNALEVGQSLDLIKALQGTQLEYDGAAVGAQWYGDLFNRAAGLVGDYTVYTTGDAFGLTRFNNVPEPTTGTLSLLALAALAARRRRK